ncbi:hypothetical protein ACHAWF_014706 [Thalassiosira exigua]
MAHWNDARTRSPGTAGRSTVTSRRAGRGSSSSCRPSSPRATRPSRRSSVVARSGRRTRTSTSSRRRQPVEAATAAWPRARSTTAAAPVEDQAQESSSLPQGESDSEAEQASLTAAADRSTPPGGATTASDDRWPGATPRLGRVEEADVVEGPSRAIRARCKAAPSPPWSGDRAMVPAEPGTATRTALAAPGPRCFCSFASTRGFQKRLRLFTNQFVNCFNSMPVSCMIWAFSCSGWATCSGLIIHALRYSTVSWGRAADLRPPGFCGAAAAGEEGGIVDGLGRTAMVFAMAMGSDKVIRTLMRPMDGSVHVDG